MFKGGIRGALVLDGKEGGAGRRKMVFFTHWNSANELYHVNAAASVSFTQDHSPGGLGDPNLSRNRKSMAAIRLDANGDSYEDVLVVNYGQANDLFLGDGNGGWTLDVSQGGLSDTTRTRDSQGAVAFDANGDKNIDVLILNENQGNDLYLCDGHGGW